MIPHPSSLSSSTPPPAELLGYLQTDWSQTALSTGDWPECKGSEGSKDTDSAHTVSWKHAHEPTHPRTHTHTHFDAMSGLMHYQTEQLLHDRWIKSSFSPTRTRQERSVVCMCLYLCVLVRVHLSSHSGIVNTDSFQLESALSNKQTSREESREVYKEITRQHKTRAP